MIHLESSWIRQRLFDYDHLVISEKTIPHRAAVAIILRESKAGDACQILFIRRAKNDQDPWSGHMAFPGGRMESKDASLLHAARRETLEEVDIDLDQRAEKLGQIDDNCASAGGRTIPLVISPFVFLLSDHVTPKPNSEVEEIHWIPATMLLDSSNASTIPYELGGQRYELPCIRVFERVIWGLTYRMLMQFFSVLEWQPQ